MICLKIYINEFAETKAEVEKYLYSHTMPIIEHLAKCLLMPNYESYNHWKGEIINHLSNVSILKNTKKYPKSQQIYDWSFGKFSDMFDINRTVKMFFHNIETEYNIKIKDNIYEVNNILMEFCQVYFSSLANDLSKYGVINKSKANKIIDNFVLNHPINIERI